MSEAMVSVFVSGRFSLFSSSNDHASDNGIKHALTLLPMMAILMMRYRSLSSQILRASFSFLRRLFFFFVCTTFIMMMPMNSPSQMDIVQYYGDIFI